MSLRNIARHQLIVLLRNKCRVLRRRQEKRKYTPYTFAEYLRRRGAQIGEGCCIESMDMEVGIENYLVRIGNNVTIGPGARFITHDGAAWIFRHQVPDLQVFGPIVVEDNCVIGRDAILCPGIRVGPGSVVTAGAVVICDVLPDTVVAGVPARPLPPPTARPAPAI